jgi:hypothetical protein
MTKDRIDVTRAVLIEMVDERLFHPRDAQSRGRSIEPSRVETRTFLEFPRRNIR